MASTIPSDATPSMLKWAREKAGFSRQDIAAAEKFPENLITEWESGKATPSLSRLRRLAKRYKRPLMVFYLPEPPREFSVAKDFRLLPAGVSRDFSPELRYALRLAQERQAWAADYLEEIGAPKCRLVSSATLQDETKRVAQNLRRKLSVTIDMQVSCRDASQAFSLWRRGCEDVGIYVFQSSRIALEEMRGCALPNQYAPVALVNGRDVAVAKSFTLIHEVAHLLLGDSAITGGGEDEFAFAPDQRSERFCNKVAAEALVPEADFIAFCPSDWKDNPQEFLRKAAIRYRVSRAVIGIRLVEIGLADNNFLRENWPSLQTPRPKPGKGGPKQHLRAIARNGEAFSRLVMSAYHAGAVHGGQINGLLGLKIKHIGALESRLYPNRVPPAG